MSFNVVLFCAQALLIQGITAQYIGAPLAAAPLAAAPCAGAWGSPCAVAEWDYAPAAALSASNGPGVAVATASPLVPAGVSVLSENAYEGILAVDGTLPFLGTVAFDGVLPTAGSGLVAYSCGNGGVGITSEENRVLAGVAGPVGYGAISAPIIGAPLSAGTYAAAWDAPYAGVEQAYLPPGSLSASNGPGLTVSSASSLVPNGVGVQSENAYEGGVAVSGAIPFLGTVAFEGALPTVGAGAVAYGCGNGAVGITAEDIGAVAGPFGIARSGWGCGAI